MGTRAVLILLACLPLANAQKAAVDDAFQRARAGDYSQLDSLAKLGAPAAAAVSAHLNDAKPVLRNEAVRLLGELKACAELEAALVNDSADVRARASEAFLKACGRKAVTPETATLLQRSIRLGNSSPVPLLLLGEAKSPETLEVLKSRLEGSEMVKWHPGSQPVHSSLPARLALLLRGNANALTEVLGVLESPSVSEARFFLDALVFIDNPAVLRSVARLLEDTRPLPNESRRRICDYAVPAFAQRFRMELPFRVRDFGRYSAEELKTVQARVAEHLKAE